MAFPLGQASTANTVAWLQSSIDLILNLWHFTWMFYFAGGANLPSYCRWHSSWTNNLCDNDVLFRGALEIVKPHRSLILPCLLMFLNECDCIKVHIWQDIRWFLFGTLSIVACEGWRAGRAGWIKDRCGELWDFLLDYGTMWTIPARKRSKMYSIYIIYIYIYICVCVCECVCTLLFKIQVSVRFCFFK